jgi:hypothetical protein
MLIFVAFFSATIDGRNLIFGHKLHIGTPYRGKRFWTHQIPTSCLPIFIHIEHTFCICPFFSATIDGRNLIFGHKLHIARYAILWAAFLDPSDSYFLSADFVDFYTHWTYMLIFRRIFLCNYWWQKSDIWAQASYRYTISWEAFLDPSDSYLLFADFYTHLTYICICTFFVAFFSATIDDRNLIFGHKLHIGISYCGKRFWTRQIPTACLPTLLVFIHIEHICSFFVAFFSATIDGRNLIFGHKLHIGTPYRGKRFLIRQISTSCLPKSGAIISEH